MEIVKGEEIVKIGIIGGGASGIIAAIAAAEAGGDRSEEHTSELQSQR